MEESRICLPVSEYTELIRKETFLDMLMRAIYVGSDLSWNGKGLAIDRSRVVEFLEVADSERYQQILETLKAEKDAKKEAEG